MKAQWGIVGWLAAILLLSSCSRKVTGFEPVVPPEPDLRAVEGYLFWGDFPIGLRTPGGSGSGAGRTAAANPAMTGVARSKGAMGMDTHDLNTVVVGTGCLPAVRQVSTVSFPSYRIHFYIDDVLWWDRESSPPAGWSGAFGLGWVPPDTGLYTVRVVLDATNLCQEVDETNNEITFQIRVIEGDLVAGLIEVLQWRDGYPHRVHSVLAGTPLQIVTWSHAWGRYENHRTRFEANGTTLFDRRMTLHGGTLFSQIEIDTIPFTPTQPGTYTLRRVVDPDAEFRDGNRSNNESSVTLQVAPN